MAWRLKTSTTWGNRDNDIVCSVRNYVPFNPFDTSAARNSFVVLRLSPLVRLDPLQMLENNKPEKVAAFLRADILKL